MLNELIIPIDEAMESLDPVELKNILLKGVIDLDEDDNIDLTTIKILIRDHIFPRMN
jgi:hypothetical protein